MCTVVDDVEVGEEPLVVVLAEDSRSGKTAGWSGASTACNRTPMSSILTASNLAPASGIEQDVLYDRIRGRRVMSVWFHLVGVLRLALRPISG